MGYKTYRLLRLFFKEYWPRHEKPMPTFERALLDDLGTAKFGDHYDAGRGVVTFAGTRERLRPGIADVVPSRLRDPDVAFFVDNNPGHERGDELACLAEINSVNIRSRMWRVFHLEGEE